MRPLRFARMVARVAAHSRYIWDILSVRFCPASETLVSVFCPNGDAADEAKYGVPPTVGLCLKKP
jgi:hypothetical protein